MRFSVKHGELIHQSFSSDRSSSLLAHRAQEALAKVADDWMSRSGVISVEVARRNSRAEAYLTRGRAAGDLTGEKIADLG